MEWKVFWSWSTEKVSRYPTKLIKKTETREKRELVIVVRKKNFVAKRVSIFASTDNNPPPRQDNELTKGPSVAPHTHPRERERDSERMKSRFPTIVIKSALSLFTLFTSPWCATRAQFFFLFSSFCKEIKKHFEQFHFDDFPRYIVWKKVMLQITFFFFY